MADKATLRAIFEKHGLDPFDAFLLDKSEWPEEARALVEADRPAMLADREKRAAAAHARRERGQRYDEGEEGR